MTVLQPQYQQRVLLDHGLRAQSVGEVDGRRVGGVARSWNIEFPNLFDVNEHFARSSKSKARPGAIVDDRTRQHKEPNGDTNLSGSPNPNAPIVSRSQ